MLRRKVSLIFIIIIGFSAPVFSEEEEGEPAHFPESSAKTWHEIGIAYSLARGYFWGSSLSGTDKVEAHTTSSTSYIHNYFFRNESNKVGFFVHTCIAGSPNVDTINGQRPEYIDYSGWQVGYTVGPLFKLAFNEKWNLLFGAGLHFLLIMEKYNQYASFANGVEAFERNTINLGMGANIALRIAFGKTIIVMAGCDFDYDFLGSVTLKSSSQVLKSSDIGGDFSMLGVRPYIATGFRL